MTTRSTRRRAELAVIDAAREYVSFNGGINPIIHAVVALNKLDLELPGDARVNRGAPVTAQQAAQWMEGTRASSMAGRIVRFMYYKRYTTWTVDDLEEALDARHQTVSARVHELRDSGWLVPDGTRKTRSGRQADVYKLSDKALEVLG